jgi:large subunit ribosomal protein L16
MLQPNRVKYRKTQKGGFSGKAHAGNFVNFGSYGIQALETAWITARQIEAARRAITHYIHRGGNIWIRIFPDKPITKKPAETRQGGGKGSPEGWAAVVHAGRIMFEVGGVEPAVAKEALRLASNKLPIDVKIVSRIMDTAGGEAK